MEITPSQFAQVEHCLPTQRGNVCLANLDVLNAILYVAEHGCKWRALPQRYGNWHTVYTRMNRWSRNGVLDRVFEQLQRSNIVRVRIEAVGLEPVPEDAPADAPEPDEPPFRSTAARPPRFIWLPRIPERP
jgi:transposase